MFSTLKSVVVGAALGGAAATSFADVSLASTGKTITCAATGEKLPSEAGSFWANRTQFYSDVVHLSHCDVDHITDFALGMAKDFEEIGFYLHKKLQNDDTRAFTSRTLCDRVSFVGQRYPNRVESLAQSCRALEQAPTFEEALPTYIQTNARLIHLTLVEDFFTSKNMEDSVSQTFCPESQVDAECREAAFSKLHILDEKLVEGVLQVSSELMDILNKEKALIEALDQLPQLRKLFFDSFDRDALEEVPLEQLEKVYKNLIGTQIEEPLRNYIATRNSLERSKSGYRYMLNVAGAMARVLDKQIQQNPKLKKAISEASYKVEKPLYSTVGGRLGLIRALKQHPQIGLLLRDYTFDLSLRDSNKLDVEKLKEAAESLSGTEIGKFLQQLLEDWQSFERASKKSVVPASN